MHRDDASTASTWRDEYVRAEHLLAVGIQQDQVRFTGFFLCRHDNDSVAITRDVGNVRVAHNDRLNWAVELPPRSVARLKLDRLILRPCGQRPRHCSCSCTLILRRCGQHHQHCQCKHQPEQSSVFPVINNCLHEQGPQFCLSTLNHPATSRLTSSAAGLRGRVG